MDCYMKIFVIKKVHILTQRTLMTILLVKATTYN